MQLSYGKEGFVEESEPSRTEEEEAIITDSLAVKLLTGRPPID